MKIIQGQTAFIKITGEEVFVLQVAPTSNETFMLTGVNKDEAAKTGFGAEVGIVRHASAGDFGVKHEIICLFLEELETLEERVEREYISRQRVNQTVSSLNPPAAGLAKTIDLPTPRIN